MRRFIISSAREVAVRLILRATPALLFVILCSALLIPSQTSLGGEGDPLPGTEKLTMTGDIARQLLDGAHRFVDAQTAEAIRRRAEAFKAAMSSSDSLEKSLKEWHFALSEMLGEFKLTSSQDFELLATTRHSSVLFECNKYKIHAVRWPVVRGVFGEGLLVEPKAKTQLKYAVIVLADEYVTDKQLDFVATFASANVRVLLPVQIDRENEHSLTQNGAFKTGLTNREFCYRPGFELGHPLVGYEVTKIIAAAHAFSVGGLGNTEPTIIGIVDLSGYGPISLYAMALSKGISFGQINLGNSMAVPMDQQPLDQNVYGLTSKIGLAELVSLIAPRRLILTESREWNRSKERWKMFGERGGPSPTLNDEYPKTPEGSNRWQSDAEELEEECFNKHSLAGDLSAWKAAVQKLQRGQIASSVSMCSNDEGPIDPTVLKHLGIDDETEATPAKGFSYTAYLKSRIGPQVKEIIDDTQHLLEEGPYQREQFWQKTKPARDKHDVKEWETATKAYRDHFREKTIGHFDVKKLPAHPRTRQMYDTPAFTGYEVVLDVYPELIAYGILLVPKGIKEGERRPVVVTQHGLEGRPQDVADPAINNPAYNQYGCRLAERGFVVFAPQNLYIFHDRFRHLQRKLNPIGKTLFSVIVPQHEQIVDWLETLPFVDGKRIGFYGLSYGGKSAMRIPALVEKYALSICSADFNDWVWKNASTRSPYSYVNTMEYEIFEFGLGPTFNYAEMAALIAPRPFMVERGHHDGVAPDDRVASEYAKIRLMYSDLGIPERTEIEFFNGPHTIHGVGTFRFLHRHLNWPSPSDPLTLNK